MEQLGLVGIGYFGKPEMVGRRLIKVFSSCNGLYDIPLQTGFEEGVARGSDAIAGFYLGFADRVLNLLLFTKGERLNPEKSPKKVIYPLRLKKMD